MNALSLDRPIVFFDLEATGTDTQKDRIVSLYGLKYYGSLDAVAVEFSQLFDPGIVMSDEVVAVHGITNEMVKGSPAFESRAELVLDFFSGCDLGGFNLINFDVPMLWESFHRAQLLWELAGCRIIDVGNIFKKKEERTLSAGVKFYTGQQHSGAHNAAADVLATVNVFKAQRDRYADLGEMNLEQAAGFSKMDRRLDMAGIIVLNAAGEPVYGTKRNRGVRLVDDPGYAYWMLRSDFSEQTKQVIRDLLENGSREYVSDDARRGISAPHAC